MERDAAGRLLVVADASFLINFLAVDRMDILDKLPGLRFHLVNHVRAEVRHGDQRARHVVSTGRVVRQFDLSEGLLPERLGPGWFTKWARSVVVNVMI